MVGCPPRALLRAFLVAALAAPAAPARVALVALWLGDGTMPRYAATTCASLARPGGAAATLVLVVDDADRAGVPASCRGVDHVQIWELGAGGVARGLAAGAARGLRLAGDARAAVEALVVKTLAAKPRVVIELKPLWLYAWRDELRAAGFDRASYADLDVVFGDLRPWVAAGDGYDVATWAFATKEDPVRLFARGQLMLLDLASDAAALRWLRCAHLSTHLAANLRLKLEGGSAAPAARNFEPLGGPGCPTVLPARPGDRYVSAEACYSCAFFSAVAGDEAAAFSARFAGLAGSAGFAVAEARALLAPLSVLTLPAVFSDHSLDRVWWADGRVVRCARLRGGACAARVAAYAASAPRAAPALGPPGAPEPVERPCGRGMEWLNESCPRSSACAAAPVGAAAAAAALDGGGALAFRPLAPPGDDAVVEAAMFHFRIWSDRRDGLFQGSTRERHSRLQRLISRPFPTRFG